MNKPLLAIFNPTGTIPQQKTASQQHLRAQSLASLCCTGGIRVRERIHGGMKGASQRRPNLLLGPGHPFLPIPTCVVAGDLVISGELSWLSLVILSSPWGSNSKENDLDEPHSINPPASFLQAWMTIPQLYKSRQVSMVKPCDPNSRKHQP